MYLGPEAGKQRERFPAMHCRSKYGDIGNFDPGNSIADTTNQPSFGELNLHLKRLPQNEKAPTAKLPALF
jgi:hypothetical protein